MINFLGIPRPSLEWWIRGKEGGSEKLLLHSDSAAGQDEQKSFLEYGPLQRGHHNNQITCEARNNDKILPLTQSLKIQMIRT